MVWGTSSISKKIRRAAPVARRLSDSSRPPVKRTIPKGHSPQLLVIEGENIDYGRIFEQYVAGDNRGVVVLNSRRHAIDINPAGRAMLQYDGPLPLPIGDIVRDIKVGFAVGDAIHDRRVLRHETFLPDPERILSLNIVPVISRDGSIDHVLMTLEDVTRLRHLETVRRDFVANVSHELRTPIASINLLVETLQRMELGEQADAAHFLRRIQVETLSMNHLVEELLQLSRLESGRLSLNVETHSVKKIVAGVKNRLTIMAGEKSITLHTDVQRALPGVLVDAMAIEQVLMNLVHNAIKFTPSGGTVTLRARLSHPGVEIEVVDTGVGMEPSEAARVFERFYKVDKSRTRATGTGLGLAIAKHLLELHHSRLQVVSEPDRGSRFTFKLPLADEE
jgi:signal transduction histidine kinase